jgi:hypothetical protein
LVGVAVNVTEPPGQIVVVDAEMLTEGIGAGVTVIGIPVLVADTGDAQGAFEVMTTVTLSLLLRPVDENTALFVPTFAPFTFHWYMGFEPPLTGVAVYVTAVPGQIDVAEAATVTEGTGAGFTVIGIATLVTEAGDAQAAFDVISTVTLSLSLRVVDENVDVFVPTLFPFTFH